MKLLNWRVIQKERKKERKTTRDKIERGWYPRRMINNLVDLSSDFGFQSVQNSSALQSFLERLICPHAPKELSPPLSTGWPKAFFVQIHRLKTRSNACPMSRRRTWFMQAFGNSTKLHISKPHEMFWDDYDLYKMMTIYMSHLAMNRSCSEVSLIILLDRGFCSPRPVESLSAEDYNLAANDNSLSLSLSSKCITTF
jgi:hypothetical protein